MRARSAPRETSYPFSQLAACGYAAIGEIIKQPFAERSKDHSAKGCFLYGFLMRKDFDFGKIFRFPKRNGMKYTRYKTVKDEPKRPVSDEQCNQQQAEKERDVDAILDKIAKNGYTSLTQDEKEFLFKNSR